MRKKKRTFKDWLLDRLYSLKPIGELIIAVGCTIGYILIFVFIVLNAQHLGLLFIPTVVAYLVPIFFVKYFIEKRDAKNQIHALGGEALYADLYPKEAAKLKRKKEKAKQRAAKKAEKIAETNALGNAKKSPRKEKKSKNRDREYKGPEF